MAQTARKRNGEVGMKHPAGRGQPLAANGGFVKGGGGLDGEHRFMMLFRGRRFAPHARRLTTPQRWRRHARRFAATEDGCGKAPGEPPLHPFWNTLARMRRASREYRQAA